MLTVVLVLGVIVLLRTQSHPPEMQTTLSLLEWRSPTDFLLQTPGHELRDSLPQVGRVPEFLSRAIK